MSDRDPVQVPAIGHPLELSFASVLEDEAASGHEVLDGLGYEHLRRTCERPNARSYHHTEPSNVISLDGNLPRMEPRPDFDPK